MDIILDISDEEINDLLNKLVFPTNKLTFADIRNAKIAIVRAWLLMIYHNHVAGD